VRYYLIAGEASGDMHGANLIKALKKKDPDSEFRVWGGEQMAEAGGDLVAHYREMAFMGFTEVVANMKTIFRYIRACKADLKATKPDVLILIDYPGFNLRIASYAKQLGLRVVYYISPQVWAWKASRVKQIRQSVDQMLVILPFEPDFYQKYNYPVTFVGHPLLDTVQAFQPVEDFVQHYKLSPKPIIALTPGSRKQEIATMLPPMITAARAYPEYQAVIAGAPGIEEDFYHRFIPRDQEVSTVHGASYSLMTYAKAGLVTSGTASLEAAIFGLPEVVCYKGGWISYWIARQLVNIPYIALPNLVLNREAVTELIQGDYNADNLVKELGKILEDSSERRQQLDDFKELRDLLGQEGASDRAAEAIHSAMKE
jgi:lipid-A-disaccharide synthase